MAGNFRGLQRGNFKDPRIRRNWNKLATWFDNMLNGDQFELGPNGELQLTGSLSENWFGYDSAGGTAASLSAAVTVPYDTESVNSDPTIFTGVAAGELGMDGNGEAFSINATVSLEHQGSLDPDWQCKVWLEVDTGSGYAEVPGSAVYVGSSE